MHALCTCPVLRFKAGERLECRMEAKGYEKAWFRAEIEQFRDDGQIKVQFYELLEEDRKGVPKAVEEWVRSERLRPFPPELVPEEYLGTIEAGDCLEMTQMDGWWQMEVLANPLNDPKAAAPAEGDAPHDPAAPSNLTKSDQLKEKELQQKLRPEPTADEARAARFHVASVQFDVEHRDAKPEVLRPVWVWKRKAGTQAKRGKEGKEGKEEGQEEEGAGGVRAFKEGDEIEGVWTKSRGCDALPLLPTADYLPLTAYCLALALTAYYLLLAAC